MKRLLLVALMVLVSLVSMVGFSRAQIPDNLTGIDLTGIEDSAFQATTNTTTGAGTELPATVNVGAQAKATVYYLTKNSFTGGDAITACDSGFHMASLFEIRDPSNLQYANRSAAAYDSLVDGQRLGPPSNHMGWVLSGGYPPSGFEYDCGDFRDNRDNRSGTTLSLNDWFEAGMEQTASTLNILWQVARMSCSQPEPVWCVEDLDYGAVTEPPATVNAWDVYSSPYYDSDKGAVSEPPAMVCTGRIDQLEGGCI